MFLFYITNVFLEHIVYLSIWRNRKQKYWFQLQSTRSVTMYHRRPMKVKVSLCLQMWSSSHLIKAYHRPWLTQLACLCLWWHTDLIQKWSQTLISVVIASFWISQLVRAQHYSAPRPRHWAAAERSWQTRLGTSLSPGAIRGLPRSGIAFSPVSGAKFILKPSFSWMVATYMWLWTEWCEKFRLYALTSRYVDSLIGPPLLPNTACLSFLFLILSMHKGVLALRFKGVFLRLNSKTMIYYLNF